MAAEVGAKWTPGQGEQTGPSTRAAAAPGAGYDQRHRELHAAKGNQRARHRIFSLTRNTTTILEALVLLLPSTAASTNNLVPRSS